jgi:midasin (ATPase involved in ribosome maturation)
LPLPSHKYRATAAASGGDYGKKELSPALSNRFTSIWVPAIEDSAELLAILGSRLAGERLQGRAAIKAALCNGPCSGA